jgi:hypothetical protein
LPHRDFGERRVRLSSVRQHFSVILQEMTP